MGTEIFTARREGAEWCLYLAGDTSFYLHALKQMFHESVDGRIDMMSIGDPVTISFTVDMILEAAGSGRGSMLDAAVKVMRAPTAKWRKTLSGIGQSYIHWFRVTEQITVSAPLSPRTLSIEYMFAGESGVHVKMSSYGIFSRAWSRKPFSVDAFAKEITAEEFVMI